jgi:uncharacterized protein (TIGR03437 family)
MSATCQIQPLQDPRWTELVERHPRSSFFHTAAWLIWMATALRTLLLSVVFLPRLALAQPAELSLPNLAVSPGASVLLSVRFASRLSSTSALQFDLQYDSSALALIAAAGDSLRSSRKTLSTANLNANQRRFLIDGINQNPLVDGGLISLFVIVSPSAGGAYALTLSNVVGTDPSGQPASVFAVNGVLTVAGAMDAGSQLQPEGVLNAAGLFAGPVAPGEIVTLLGGAIGLDGASVLFDGTSAPLFYTAPNQINALVPSDIYGQSTRLQITQRGQPIAGLVLAVSEAAPAIFTMDGSGVGQGAILNQDQKVNSFANPAVKGDTVVLFATGAGQTDAAGKPALPISAQIGGLDAQVRYAGVVSPGLLQVNCVVPFAVPSGPVVPVALVVGESASPAGVTLAIR